MSVFLLTVNGAIPVSLDMMKEWYAMNNRRSTDISIEEAIRDPEYIVENMPVFIENESGKEEWANLTGRLVFNNVESHNELALVS